MARPALLGRLFRQPPARPGDSYGAPGQGSSLAISAVTVVALLFLWWLVTALGLMKPLFLPSPQAVLQRFVKVMNEGFGGATLWHHTLASLARVFGAFVLAAVLAIPIGIGMGINRVLRGVFDPPIEFYRPLPPLAYLPLTIIWFGIDELQKVILLFLAIGAVEWLTMARIVRGQVLSLKKQEFVEAAVSLGFSHWRIIFRHLVPNTMGPVIVYTTLTVPAVMRLEAVLSFLGMGVQPPDSSWGTLIKEGADRMDISLWLLVFPSAIFAVTLFCLNFLGDGLRDALDPKSSKD